MAPDPTSVERPRQRNNGGRDSLDREKYQLVSSYGERYSWSEIKRLLTTALSCHQGNQRTLLWALRLRNEIDLWQKGSYYKFFLCTDSPTFAVKIKTQRKAKNAPSIEGFLGALSQWHKRAVVSNMLSVADLERTSLYHSHNV